MADWTEIPQYQPDSRSTECSVTGMPKDHRHPRVFRSVMIDQEGFFDIGEVSAKQLATLLGWSSPQYVETILRERDEAIARVDAADADREVAQQVADSLIKDAARFREESADYARLQENFRASEDQVAAHYETIEALEQQLEDLRESTGRQAP